MRSDLIIGSMIDQIVTMLHGYSGQRIDYTDRTNLRANGLVFSVDLDVEFYGYDTDGNTKIWPTRRGNKTIHFLYYGGTAVWCAVVETNEDRRYKWQEIKMEEWKFLTAHDSCWRGRAASEIFTHWLEMRDYVLQDVPDERRSEMIHRVNDSTRLGGTFTEPFAAVDITLKSIKTEDFARSYHPFHPTSITKVALKPEWAVPSKV